MKKKETVTFNNVRLTDNLRRTICNSITSALYDDQIEKIREQKQEAANKLVDSLLGDYKSAVSALPDSIFGPGTVDIDFCVDGRRMRIDLKEQRRIPYNLQVHNGYKCTSEGSPIAANILRIMILLEELHDAKREKGNVILATLRSVNTIKQLAVLWPECIPYLPDSALNNKKTPPVPAPALVEINKLLAMKKEI